MVLGVHIAKIHANQVLERFEERLVEMEIGEFARVLEKHRHDVVYVLNGLLRYYPLLVTSSL